MINIKNINKFIQKKILIIYIKVQISFDVLQRDIIRTFLSKLKRISKLIKDFHENNDLNKTITDAKPPIFWKDKDLVKHQIKKWSPAQINKLIFDANEIELQIKKNNINPVNIISNFILDKSSMISSSDA